MPSAWGWWAGSNTDVEYEGTFTHGEFATRKEAIAAVLPDLCRDEVAIEIVEARSSSAVKFEGAERVPFTHQRNRETLGIEEARKVVLG